MSTRRILLLACLFAPAIAAAAPPDAARAAVAARDYAGAQRVLEQHLATTPDDDESRFLLARVLAWRGQPDRALPIYAALLAREPDNADYLFGQGQALLWAGRAGEALSPLERAQALVPDYPELAAALAQARAASASGASNATPTTAGTGPTAPSIAAADEGPVARTGVAGIGVSVRNEWLDRGLDDWRAYRVDAASVPRDALGWYGAINHEQRFGLSDTGVEFGLVAPFGAGWTVQAEIGGAPGAEFLPRGYGDLRLQRALDGGWVVGASVRHTAYRDTDVDRLALGVERYAGNWRAGYTLNLTAAAGERLVGHDLSLDRYYADRSSVGLRLSTGEDTALQGVSVVASDVDAAWLQGRHWFAPDWALQWSAGASRQGELYDRRWVQLGVWRGW